jgi:hypothetical protein
MSTERRVDDERELFTRTASVREVIEDRSTGSYVKRWISEYGEFRSVMKITSAREADSQLLSVDDKVGECLPEVGASRDLIVPVRVKKRSRSSISKRRRRFGKCDAYSKKKFGGTGLNVL